MKNSKILLLFVCLVLIPIVIMSKRVNDNKNDVESIGSNEIPVRVEEIKIDRISQEVSYSGKTIPKMRVNVISKVPGTVIAINYEVGDSVHKGDVLLIIDDRDIQRNIEDIKTQIETAKVGISISDTTYVQTEKLYKKNQSLYESGVISKNDLENLELKLNQQKDQLKQSYLNVERLENSLKGLEDKANDTIVRSPIDGVINKRRVEIGEITSSSKSVFELIDMSQVYIDVKVSQENIDLVKNAKDIEVDVNGLNKSMEGSFSYISPAANENSLTYDTRIIVNNNNSEIMPGMLCKIIFTVKVNDYAQIIPIDGLIEKDGDIFIYIVNEENRVEKINVEVGIEEKEEVEILTDIPDNGYVVVDGKEYLADLDKVLIVRE